MGRLTKELATPRQGHALCKELFVELYRVLRRDRHAYLFCDPETAFVMKPIGESVGFRFWKPLIWDKVTMGMGYHYRARYEMILFFEKGKRKLNDLGVPDVLQARRIHRGYPTEKPVEISEILVRQSTREGEIVIDPFMGSGSVGVAAVGTKRSFAGCDIAMEAVAVTRRRLLETGAMEEAMLSPVEQATCGVQLSLADARGRAVVSRKQPRGDAEGPTRRPIVPEVAE